MLDTRRLPPSIRSKLVLLFGLLLAIAGGLGTIALSALLVYTVPRTVSGEWHFFSHQALFQSMWAVFFVSLFMTGVSLVVSGANRKRKDLVPGLTLYFLGAALVVNGLLMLTYGHWIFGAVMIAVGAVAVYLEWSTEVV